MKILLFTITFALFFTSCSWLLEPKQRFSSDDKIKLHIGQELIYSNQNNESDTFMVESIKHDFTSSYDYGEEYEYYNVKIIEKQDASFLFPFEECLNKCEKLKRECYETVGTDSCRVFNGHCYDDCHSTYPGRDILASYIEFQTMSNGSFDIYWRDEMNLYSDNIDTTFQSLIIKGREFKKVKRFIPPDYAETDVSEIYFSNQYGIIKYHDHQTGSWELVK